MSKVKIPKKVGGVKIPKKLRKQAKKAVRLAESPAVRELAAAAIGAAAMKVAESVRSREAADKAAKKTGRQIAAAEEKAEDAAAELRREAAKLGDLVRAAALEGARRILENVEDAARPDKPRGKSGSKNA